jgi:hypothetical protein
LETNVISEEDTNGNQYITLVVFSYRQSKEEDIQRAL